MIKKLILVLAILACTAMAAGVKTVDVIKATINLQRIQNRMQNQAFISTGISLV